MFRFGGMDKRHKSVFDSINHLKISLDSFKTIASVSDVRVRQTFSMVTEWEKEIFKIKESKTNFDEEMYGVKLDPSKIEELKSKYHK